MSQDKEKKRIMPAKVVQIVKKTLRQRSKSTESNTGKKASRKEPSQAERDSKNTKTKANPGTNRKQGTRRNSGRKPVTKSASKESNASSISREVEPRSRMSKMDKSIDLEEDPEPPAIVTPTPETVTRRDEVKDPKTSAMEEVKEVKPKEELKSPAPITPKPPKLWAGLEAAMKLWAKVNDIEKIKNEYLFLESLQCNKTTEASDANTERNRDRAPKIYDENRVVLNRPGHEDNNYINASFINVKDFAHKLIIAQLPRMENESFVEDFWHMIYQEQITLVYLLVPEVVLAKAPTKLFKDQKDEYQYVGKMFINSRKADDTSDPKEYLVEVLPEGNSDSVMCQVHHHATWQHFQPPPKTRVIIKMIHQFLTEKEIQAANVCVVSEFGSGRACSFIGALIAIHQLNKGQEPNILEIMTNIKQQRPGATETFAQYAGIYAIVLDYIRRKGINKSEQTYKELTGFIDELAQISPPNSPNR